MNLPLARRIAFVLGAIGASLLSGCTTTQPWERGTLADYTMRPDRDTLIGPMTEHIYFSREASAGGEGVGGGGCGCN